jgi:hypothetical protein
MPEEVLSNSVINPDNQSHCVQLFQEVFRDRSGASESKNEMFPLHQAYSGFTHPIMTLTSLPITD